MRAKVNIIRIVEMMIMKIMVIKKLMMMIDDDDAADDNGVDSVADNDDSVRVQKVTKHR